MLLFVCKAKLENNVQSLKLKGSYLLFLLCLYFLSTEHPDFLPLVAPNQYVTFYIMILEKYLVAYIDY